MEPNPQSLRPQHPGDRHLLGRSPGRGMRSASSCLEQRVREHGVFSELSLESPVL